ncbi:hypothetical protein [Arachidicoccus sp.]|uniref:hypothetical protein n=1 Tax=Arachidicoccus sp. TaxID=1872624 RepID=UPI003D1EDD6E
MQTSEREKIVAFQNAILNTAKGEAPEKSKTQIFVNILNEFTIWHLKILDLMKNPKEWFESQKLPIPKSITYTISDVIYDAFPDLKDQTALLNYVCNDLARMGLLDAVSSSSLRTMMTVDGALANRITPFGEEFMNFVTFKK